MSSLKLKRPILEAFDVRKNYETKAGPLPVLKGVHFNLEPGEMSFLIGRSGSGKSTLMHILGCLDMPSSGKVLFEGEDITSMNEKSRDRLRNQRLGFVFQSYHLLPELTLYENVILPSLIAGKKDTQWIQEVLRRVKLLSRKHHYPSELSGGEQQRAAIARALINHPSVVFCDEPTGNLDEETAESVFSLLNELNREQGQSFVVVTHDEALAWRYESVYRLVDGILLKENPGKVGMEQIK